MDFVVHILERVDLLDVVYAKLAFMMAWAVFKAIF